MIADQIQAEKEREDLVRRQTEDRQRALDLAIEEEERRKEMTHRQSYVGGTATRFGQFQASAAVDDQAGVGGGMMAGMQESLMQLGTAARMPARWSPTRSGRHSRPSATRSRS